MSDNIQAETEENLLKESSEDRLVDAVCTVLIVVIPVIAVIYWLSGMPAS